MEERLHQPPLPKVQLALAGEQPLAEHALRHLQRLPLHEGSLLGDQHFADQLGMVQEHLALGSEAEAGDVAVLPGDPEQRPGRIAPERERERAWDARPRARWKGSDSVPHRTPESVSFPALVRFRLRSRMDLRESRGDVGTKLIALAVLTVVSPLPAAAETPASSMRRRDRPARSYRSPPDAASTEGARVASRAAAQPAELLSRDRSTLYLAMASGGADQVLALDPGPDSTLRTLTLDGTLGARRRGSRRLDHRAAANGESLVLQQAPDGRHTRFAVIDTSFHGRPAVCRARGRYALDGVASTASPSSSSATGTQSERSGTTSSATTCSPGTSHRLSSTSETRTRRCKDSRSRA